MCASQHRLLLTWTASCWQDDAEDAETPSMKKAYSALRLFCAVCMHDA
jgi:hypothetical protein